MTNLRWALLWALGLSPLVALACLTAAVFLLQGCVQYGHGVTPATVQGVAYTDTSILTVSVQNAMPASDSGPAYIYPVSIRANCGQVLQPPGFALPAGETKSMGGTPGCYPFSVLINDPFYQYVCTLTVAAPGAYAVKHGGLAICDITQQSSDAVTVSYAQILLKPNDTPGGIVSKADTPGGIVSKLEHARNGDLLIKIVNEYRSTPAAFFNNEHPPAITVCSLVSPCLPGMYKHGALLPYKYGDRVLASNFPWQPDETCVLYRGHVTQGAYTHCYYLRRILHYRLTPP